MTEIPKDITELNKNEDSQTKIIENVNDESHDEEIQNPNLISDDNIERENDVKLELNNSQSYTNISENEINKSFYIVNNNENENIHQPVIINENNLDQTQQNYIVTNNQNNISNSISDNNLYTLSQTPSPGNKELDNTHLTNSDSGVYSIEKKIEENSERVTPSLDTDIIIQNSANKNVDTLFINNGEIRPGSEPDTRLRNDRTSTIQSVYSPERKFRRFSSIDRSATGSGNTFSYVPAMRSRTLSHRSPSEIISIGLRSAPLAVEITELDDRNGFIYGRLINDYAPRNRVAPKRMGSTRSYTIRPMHYEPIQRPIRSTMVNQETEWVSFSEHHETEHYLNKIGPEPTDVICPKCGRKTITKVVKKPSTCAFLTGGLLFLSGCFLLCCLIPCWHGKCQSTDHYCTWCNSYLGRYSRY